MSAMNTPSVALPSSSSLRPALAAGQPILAPLCLDPYTARLAAGLGFTAGYLSGGALGYALAVSEGLLSLSELADAARAITSRSDLALILDIGAGFGDPVHVTRTIWDAEAAGAAAVEMEDQVAPKRVSHHRGVETFVSVSEMVAKIEVAVAARNDPELVIMARTGVVRHQGFEAGIERCSAYLDAGADAVMIFPRTPDEWQTAPTLLPGPVATIATLDRHSEEEWQKLGYAIVVDPYTTHVAVYRATRDAYRSQRAGHGYGRPVAELDALYGEMSGVAGLGPLFDIERTTTERGER